MILQPFKQVIVSSGKMDYCTSSRAWGRIRLKKDFIEEFPQLRHRRFKTSYNLVTFRIYGLLEREIQNIIRNKKSIPGLLFFDQEVE